MYVIMFDLSKYKDGIPFSALRKKLPRKKHKRTKNSSASPTRKKRKARRRTKKRPIKIPPSKVIIRKKGKLYKSDGKKLPLLSGTRV